MDPILRTVLRVSFAVFVAILIVCSLGFAQVGSGKIVGSVKDPTGAAVPVASVLVRHATTGVETKVATSVAGDYSTGNLPVGTYSVTVTKPGFQTTMREGVPVVLGQTVTVDIDLLIGAVSQVVNVVAALPTVDTSSTVVGTTMTLSEITDLPLQVGLGNQTQARNPVQFIQTLPGVNGTIIQGAGEGNFRQVQTVKVDGLQEQGDPTQAMADVYGIVPELVQEFRVQTNANAESGWDLGSSVELVTKSGTNKFHGILSEYLRNDVLDSRGFFQKNRTPVRQNEYGAMVGGPIVKDKLFFMGYFGGFNGRLAPGSTLLSLPTAKMRTGDFSELLGAQVGTDALGRPVYTGEIYDPASTRQLPNGATVRDPFNYNGQLNVIPPGQLSPISQYFQKGYPLPTSAGTQLNWASKTIPNNWDEYRVDAKIDYIHGSNRVSFGYETIPKGGAPGCSGIFNSDTAFAFGPEIFTCGTYTRKNWRYRLGDSVSLAPNMVLELGLAYIHPWIHILLQNPTTFNAGAAAGLRGTFLGVMPYVTIASGQGFGGLRSTHWEWPTTWPAKANLSWIKGRHDIKIGAEYLNAIKIFRYEFWPDGQYNFAARETGLPGFPASGWGYASYLLGVVDSGQMNSPYAQRNSSSAWGLFAQDRWRATSKLTINYGLRWDIFVTPHESYDRMAFFDPTIPNPAAGGHLGAITFFGPGAGRNGRHNILDTWYKAFGPRLGIAYQLNPKTVVRASYGIQYYPLYGTDYIGVGAPNYGWGVSYTPATLDSGVTPAFDWDNGWPNPLPNLPILNPSIVNGGSVPYNNPKDNKAGMSQNIGFSVERTLRGQVSIKADYVGKLQHGLPSSATVELNQLDLKYLSLGNLLLADINSPQARAAGIALPYSGFTGSVAQALRPFPQYNDINQLDAKDGNLLYHSLQLSAQKRVGQSLTLLANWTIAKTLSNDHYACFQCYAPPYMQFAVLRGSYKEILPADRSQIVNLSYSYELPIGPGKRFLSSSNPVLRQVVGGWKVAGIHTYQTGTTLFVTTQQSIPSAGGIWANRVLGVPIRTNVGCGSYNPNDPSSRYLNANAFTAPQPFTLGNTYNLSNVRACGPRNENITIVKVFPIREDLRLEFAADAFNIFNRHYWGGPNTNINSPAFGRISSASNPRQIQLHLRLEF